MPRSCEEEAGWAGGPRPREQRGRENVRLGQWRPSWLSPVVKATHNIGFSSSATGWWGKVGGGVILGGFESWLCFLVAVHLLDSQCGHQ